MPASESRKAGLTVRVQRLPHGQDLPLPSYATAGAAGMDLLAAVAEPVTLQPGGRTVIPTGLCIALPPDMSCRSGPGQALP